MKMTAVDFKFIYSIKKNLGFSNLKSTSVQIFRLHYLQAFCWVAKYECSCSGLEGTSHILLLESLEKHSVYGMYPLDLNSCIK